MYFQVLGGYGQQDRLVYRSLLQNIVSLLQGSFAKETYNFIDSTNQSHPICIHSLTCADCSYFEVFNLNYIFQSNVFIYVHALAVGTLTRIDSQYIYTHRICVFLILYFTVCMLMNVFRRMRSFTNIADFPCFKIFDVNSIF